MTFAELMNILTMLAATVISGLFGLLMFRMQARQQLATTADIRPVPQSEKSIWRRIGDALFGRHFLRWMGSLYLLHSGWCAINLVIAVQTPGPLARSDVMAIAIWTVLPFANAMFYCWLSNSMKADRAMEAVRQLELRHRRELDAHEEDLNSAAEAVKVLVEGSRVHIESSKLNREAIDLLADLYHLLKERVESLSQRAIEPAPSEPDRQESGIWKRLRDLIGG